MPSLYVKEGPEQGRAFDLRGPRVTVGRAPDKDIVLRHRTISRDHAVFLARNGVWFVRDTCSRNQVLVNGAPVVSSVLNNGDEVGLGGAVLVFREPAQPEPGAQLPAAATDTEITTAVPLPLPGRSTAAGHHRLAALVALGGLAAAVRSVPALLTAVSEHLSALVDVDRVVPLTMDEREGFRAFVAARREFAESAEKAGVNLNLVRKAVEDGPVAVREHTPQEATVACVPIRVGELALGALYCERRGDPPVEFTADELGDLCTIGIGVGLVMQGIRRQRHMASRTRSLIRQIDRHYDMVGESDAMKKVYRFIHRVAPTHAGVFICGESGTGKEMVARAIHRHSRRSDGPLEIVNCAAVSPTLAESELFGHAEGAFTGAIAQRPGRFELADGGTLFLDEVGELPLPCQTKLLRVLEQEKVRRLGEVRDRSVDVRLIAVTNYDPRQAVREGKLREDLFYRLDRLRIHLPPLRDRCGDIVCLAEHFRQKFALQCKRVVEGFDPDVLRIFRHYRWPGNVRELRNVVERMVILGEEPTLTTDLIPSDIRRAARERSHTPEPLDEVERKHIIHMLRETGGNKKRAAELLGIDRSTLYAKIKRWGIDI